MPDYNMLFQGPNAGQSFQQGFQQAQDNRQRQQMMQMQMQRQQQQDQRQSQQDHVAELERHKDGIVAAGKLIRSIKRENPQMPDDQVYTIAHGMAVRMNIPGADQAPAQFNPEYYKGLLTTADAFDPEKTDNPSSVREFEYAKQQGFAGSYTDFIQMVHPPSPVTIPANATVSAPDVPKVSDEASYNAIPPGTKYMAPDGHVRIKGGATGSAPSSNFP